MMWWVWAIVAIVVVVGIFVAALMVKRKRRTSPPGVDDMKRGMKRFSAHVEQETARLDEQIEESTERIAEIDKAAATVSQQRKEDHETISDAGGWDELGSIARDIEKR